MVPGLRSSDPRLAARLSSLAACNQVGTSRNGKVGACFEYWGACRGGRGERQSHPPHVFSSFLLLLVALAIFPPLPPLPLQCVIDGGRS